MIWGLVLIVNPWPVKYEADAAASAIGGAQPVSVPAAGAIGLETTLWLLDEEAAAKLPAKGRSG